MKTRFVIFCDALVILSLAALADAAPAQVPDRGEKPAAVFSTDAGGGIAAATAKAAGDNKRVLVLWGENGNEASSKLHAALKKDEVLSKILRYEFVLVPIDGRANAESARTLGVDVKTSLPVLSILGADGKAVAHKAAAELDGDEALGTWLEENKAPALDARQVYAKALADAAAANKRVLVHLGAPW